MNIVFVSEMKDMKVDASSTQIMTYNLVYGLNEAGHSVTFLAVCEDTCDTESVVEDFHPITFNVTCLPSAINLISQSRGKLSKHLVMFKPTLMSSWYKSKLETAQFPDTVDCILTHLPAIESAYYANVLKKKYPMAEYIQYWSDPLARSGLTASAKLPTKRQTLRLLEHHILKSADEIVYGTSLLMETQVHEFPDLARKIRYCDVSYNVYNGESRKIELFDNTKPVIGYVGSYRTVHRNIDPLYTVMKKNPQFANLILCGKTDIAREGTTNIKIIERCSPKRALGIEEQLDIHVCLLNKTMSQIPGKIFYQTNSGKPILVILDGPDKDRIKEYLMKFNRFEFAENTEDDIYRSICNILAGRTIGKLEPPEQLSPIRFAQSVIGDRLASIREEM